ncbi:SMP-30/gluconolactonase/LRE family protein [Paenibacillus sp. IB182496]|uniref:SMP-30/gluconolactonase/LRE family protein n=2 Tax=Paenibacillus sabuli TaxID=2772509 RepID=A0A927GUS2_9BACL|nr:SMP-30/gluconolactonase/LRE family protein [Paenibacillus sabuli]
MSHPSRGIDGRHAGGGIDGDGDIDGIEGIEGSGGGRDGIGGSGGIDGDGGGLEGSGGINGESGGLERRSVISYEGREALPDGMTIDAQGMLWVAEWDGWRVSRWNPHTGEPLGYVEVPAQQVTSCAFGGPDGDVLLITTAREGLTEQELARQPHAGGVFRARVGIAGDSAHRFAG